MVPWTCAIEKGDSLPEAELRRRLAHTREILCKAILRKTGAHYVIDDFPQLIEVIDDVNARLARGERP